MADTNSLQILWYTNITHHQSNIILIASFHNAFASLFNKTETTLLLVDRPYDFKSITSWLILLPLYQTCATHWFLSKDSWFMHYICHIEMQLAYVIESIDWYQGFVALSILIRYRQNSTNTDTGIGIGALLKSMVTTSVV